MTELRLKVEGVRVRFGGTLALDGVDLAVYPGEVLALIGENGAGKSTLMKVLSGAVRPQEGSMLLDGQSYAPQNPKEARARGVAMIYQELALAPEPDCSRKCISGHGANQKLSARQKADERTCHHRPARTRPQCRHRQAR